MQTYIRAYIDTCIHAYIHTRCLSVYLYHVIQPHHGASLHSAKEKDQPLCLDPEFFEELGWVVELVEDNGGDVEFSLTNLARNLDDAELSERVAQFLA